MHEHVAAQLDVFIDRDQPDFRKIMKVILRKDLVMLEKLEPLLCMSVG